MSTTTVIRIAFCVAAFSLLLTLISTIFPPWWLAGAISAGISFILTGYAIQRFCKQ